MKRRVTLAADFYERLLRSDVRRQAAEDQRDALYKAIVESAKSSAREYDDGEHEWRAYLTPAEADAIAMVEGESKEAA